MADISLYTIRHRVGRLMGAMHTATPNGGFSTTATNTKELAVYVDDYFNDWHGHFFAGSNRDTDFEVTDSAKANGKLTVSPAASDTIDAQDLLELHQDFAPIEINDFINLAISMVEEEALLDSVDETIQAKAATFEYTIPDMYSIDRVYLEQGTGDRYSQSGNLIDRRHYRILHSNPPKLWFNDSYVTLTAGRTIRLVGTKVQAQLVKDDDMCSISQVFVVYQAKALLHESRIRGEDFEGHTIQMRLAQARANEEREGMLVPMRGIKV